MDKDNKNQAWKEAMDKEIKALINYGCFEFMPPGFKPDDSYQECPLRMIFDVKQCGKFKARLVAGGHKVDAGSPFSLFSRLSQLCGYRGVLGSVMCVIRAVLLRIG